MKTVRLSESIMNKLRKDGEAWGRIYTYKLAERLTDRTWNVYRWRTYYLHSRSDMPGSGFRFCTFDYAKRNAMLEPMIVKGV